MKNDAVANERDVLLDAATAAARARARIARCRVGGFCGSLGMECFT